MADLSPVAQAVLDAITAVSPAPADEIAAAALRALADHQTPAWDGGPLCHWTPTPHTRQELRNIAAELDATTRDPLEPNDLSHLSEEEFQALAPQGYHGV